MKKIIGILIIASFSTFTANAEILSVGISGNAGMLDAKGSETFNSKTSTRSEELAIAYVSGFAELHAPFNIGPGNFRAGISFVPYALESETTTRVAAEGELGGNPGDAERTPKPGFTQKVQVDIEDLTQMYISYHVGMFFVKGGVMEADLVTNEKLGSGSSYGNASLEGSFWAIGFDKPVMDNGIFIRGELAQTAFDAVKLLSTGSDNTNIINISGLDGINFGLSVGKSF